jgi:hypothetical protein
MFNDFYMSHLPNSPVRQSCKKKKKKLKAMFEYHWSKLHAVAEDNTQERLDQKCQ